MKNFLAAALIISASSAAKGETILIATEDLASKVVYDVADLTPLSLTSDGKPAVVLLSIKDGEVIPPHDSDVRVSLITVLSGTMYWGDGGTVVEADERAYPAGSVLAMLENTDHWVAARHGDVQLQVILIRDGKAAPGIEGQLK